MSLRRAHGPTPNRLIGGLLGLAAGGLLAGANLLGLTAPLDRQMEDMLSRLPGERAAHGLIALVELDDATLQAYGDWPLPRDQQALLLEALDAAGARAVGFDLLFIGADRYNVLNDALLAAQSSGRPDVVHAITFREPGGTPIGDPPDSILADFLARHALPAVPVAALQAAPPLLPYESLLQTAGALGHVAVANDADGVIRRLPPWLAWHQRLVPSLSLRLAATGRGGWPISLKPSGRGTEILWADGSRTHLPIDGDGLVRFTYRGDRAAFPRTYSFLDVLANWKAGRRDDLATAFGGRIVLVGSTAAGEAAADLGVTPFSSRTPRLYAQANALDALLRGDFVQEPLPALFAGVLVLLAGAIGILLATLSPLRSVLAALLLTLATGATVAWLLLGPGWAVPPFVPLILPATVLVAVGGWQARHRQGRIDEDSREREAARHIQARLLPHGESPRPDLEIYAYNQPSRDVSGDYYDWIRRPDGSLAIILADVSGKGLPAALLMSNLQASFRAQASRREHGAADIVRAMHEALTAAVTPGRFATLFLGIVSADGATLTYANAGHNPPLLVRKGPAETLDPTGGAVGLFADTHFHEETADFPPGAWLVLYSDGITEARSGPREYGEAPLATRVTELTATLGTPRALGEALLDDLAAFHGPAPYADDISLLVLRRRRPPTP